MQNAFATGVDENAAIGITDGILKVFNAREVAGILAHEISHIKHRDTIVMALADTMNRLTAGASQMVIFLLIISVPLVLFGGYQIAWIPLLLLLVAPSAGNLLQLGLSRTREYAADLEAARLTGDPKGLASALRKLERLTAGRWEQVLLPGRRIPEPSLLRTHPPTEERIARFARAPASGQSTATSPRNLAALPETGSSLLGSTGCLCSETPVLAPQRTLVLGESRQNFLALRNDAWHARTMVLNYIWISFFLIAFATGLAKLLFWGDTAVLPAMVDSLFSMAETGATISLGYIGLMTLWLGIMKVGEAGGMVNFMAKLVAPFFTRIFPDVPKGHPAHGSMMMNFAANMLGLDNSATPLGLKAMGHLQELNPDKETASNAQIIVSRPEHVGAHDHSYQCHHFACRQRGREPNGYLCSHSHRDLRGLACGIDCHRPGPEDQSDSTSDCRLPCRGHCFHSGPVALLCPAWSIRCPSCRC